MHKTLTNLKELTDNNTLILGDFNTPLISMDRSPKQKTEKEIMAVKDTGKNGFHRYIQNIPF